MQHKTTMGGNPKVGPVGDDVMLPILGLSLQVITTLVFTGNKAFNIPNHIKLI